MPAIKLYGRRWHFGTDVIPLPAALAFAFHFSWLLIMLALVRQWPGQCESWEGVAYTTLFSLYFASFATASIIDAFLFYNAIKGAPFEEKKRKMVVPLLYIGTGPLLIQAAATLYGTWVAIDLQPDCWESGDNTRNAVKNFAQALVFINWAFCFLTLWVIFFSDCHIDIEEINHLPKLEAFNYQVITQNSLFSAGLALLFFTICIQMSIRKKTGNSAVPV